MSIIPFSAVLSSCTVKFASLSEFNLSSHTDSIFNLEKQGEHSVLAWAPDAVVLYVDQLFFFFFFLLLNSYVPFPLLLGVATSPFCHYASQTLLHLANYCGLDDIPDRWNMLVSLTDHSLIVHLSNICSRKSKHSHVPHYAFRYHGRPPVRSVHVCVCKGIFNTYLCLWQCYKCVSMCLNMC